MRCCRTTQLYGHYLCWTETQNHFFILSTPFFSLPLADPPRSTLQCDAFESAKHISGSHSFPMAVAAKKSLNSAGFSQTAFILVLIVKSNSSPYQLDSTHHFQVISALNCHLIITSLLSDCVPTTLKHFLKCDHSS